MALSGFGALCVPSESCQRLWTILQLAHQLLGSLSVFVKVPLIEPEAFKLKSV